MYLSHNSLNELLINVTSFSCFKSIWNTVFTFKIQPKLLLMAPQKKKSVPEFSVLKTSLHFMALILFHSFIDFTTTWNCVVLSSLFSAFHCKEGLLKIIQLSPCSCLYLQCLCIEWGIEFHHCQVAWLEHPPLGLPWWRSGWESACQCRGHRFEPWTGRIPHAAEQLGPWATITEPALLEPVLRNKRGHDNEGPAHRDEEWPPLAATRESPCTETKTQHSHK